MFKKVALSLAMLLLCTAGASADMCVKLFDGSGYTDLPVQEPAYIENGTTMAPVRALCEALGCTVEWDNAVMGVSITDGKTAVTLHIGSAEAVVNGQPTFILPPVLKNGTTMAPLRFLCETFGMAALYADDTAKSGAEYVFITLPDAPCAYNGYPLNSQAAGGVYRLCENGTVLQTAEGLVTESGWENIWCLSFEDANPELAVGGTHDPYPRQMQPSHADYTALTAKMNEAFSAQLTVCEAYEIDLDGDGAAEHLVTLADRDACTFLKLLLDKNGEVAAYLTVLQQQLDLYADGELRALFSEQVRELFAEDLEVGALVSGTECADLNGDGCMEIVADIPVYEAFWHQQWSYIDGVLIGPSRVDTSVLP